MRILTIHLFMLVLSMLAVSSCTDSKKLGPAPTTTKEAIPYKLQVADKYAEIEIPANSVQTVRIGL